MYNAPTPTQSLMARKPIAPVDPKTGMTPDFLNVLAMMAVDKAAEGWQREQAMKQGQTPPTVAETAGQQAASVMQQQLVQQFAQNHPAQSQQQQAQQGGLQAAAQTQGAAEGGLTKLKTNLPTKYAGGGIVAFDEGGYGLSEMYDQLAESLSGLNLIPAIKGAVGSVFGEGRDARIAANKAQYGGAEAPAPWEKPTAGPGSAGFGTELGKDRDRFKPDSLEQLVGVALSNPSATEGLLAQLRDQFGTEAVNSTVAKLQTTTAPAAAETTSLRNRAGLPNGGYATDTPGGLAKAAAAPAQSEFERAMREGLLTESKRGRNADRDEAIANAKRLYGDKADASATGLRALLDEMDKKHTDAASGRSGWRDFINDVARGTMSAKPGKWEDAVLGTMLAGEQRKEGYAKADKEHLLEKLKLRQGIDALDIGVAEKVGAAGDRVQSDASAALRSTYGDMARVHATDESAATRLTTAQIAADSRAEIAADRQAKALEAATQRNDTNAVNALKALDATMQAAATQRAKAKVDAFLKDVNNVGKAPPDVAEEAASIYAQLMAKNPQVQQLYKQLNIDMTIPESAPTGGSKAGWSAKIM